MRLLYNRRQLTRKRSKAVGCGKEQMYKKSKGTAKINLPLGQAWLLLPILFDITAGTLNIAKEFCKQRQRRLHIFSYEPRVGSDILANYKTAYSVYLLCSLFSIFLIYLSLIYLSYTFIYLFIYFYSFIYYFTPSAIRPPPSATRRPHPPSVSASYRHPFNAKSGALCFSKQHCYWQDRLKIQGFFVLVVAMDPNMHI